MVMEMIGVSTLYAVITSQLTMTWLVRDLNPITAGHVTVRGAYLRISNAAQAENVYARFNGHYLFLFDSFLTCFGHIFDPIWA
jgi:hypothetical protein